MSKLIARLRGVIDRSCIEPPAAKLERDRCGVPLEGVPRPMMVVDFDKPGSPRLPKRKICDYLVVARRGKNSDWIVPIEVKSGRLHSASHAAKQLQGGADSVKGFLSDADRFDLFPVVDSMRASAGERKKLRRKANRIRLKHLSREALFITCGEALSARMLGSGRKAARK